MDNFQINGTEKTIISLTAPKRGIYIINCEASAKHCSSYVLFTIYVNTTLIRSISAAWSPSGIPFRGCGACIRSLNQGDVVKLTGVTGGQTINAGGNLELCPLYIY